MSQKITLNVNGTRYEISQKTLEEIKSRSSGAAYDILTTELKNGGSEVCIERGDQCFRSVLGYFQGRGLHMPSTVCTMEFKNELDFWGIDASEMEKCCYSKYISFFDDQGALTILERDQQKKISERADLQDRKKGTGWRSLQANTWLILEEPTFSIAARVYFWISAIFVVMSILQLVCGTHPYFNRELNKSEWQEFFGDEFYLYEGHFGGAVPVNTTLPPLPDNAVTHVDYLPYIEYVTVVYFSVEIIVRFIFCPFKRQFFLSFLNWVDIFSLAVMYSKYIVNLKDPREKYLVSIYDIMHCLQIVRVFRLFRLVKNVVGFRVMWYTVKASGVEAILMSMYLLVAMLLFSAFVFFSGDETFTSIPDAFWWAIITMTTVGYGDVFPKIPLSKAIGALTAITGVCLLAIIIPIFVNNFMLFYAYSKVWGELSDRIAKKTDKDCGNKMGLSPNRSSSIVKVEPLHDKELNTNFNAS